jgi:hypothetical protein
MFVVLGPVLQMPNVGEIISILDVTVFNITFLVGALTSLAMILMMTIMRRQAISRVCHETNVLSGLIA